MHDLWATKQPLLNLSLANRAVKQYRLLSLIKAKGVRKGVVGLTPHP